MPLSSSYVPNVPQSNQQINNTQQPIEGNFQDIADLLAINHIPFNTSDTFGRHLQVSYVDQGQDPSTNSTEMALYSKSVTNDPNLSELFYRYPNNGSVVQLTGINTSSTTTGGSGLSSGGTFSATTTVNIGYPVVGYWQYLSNGILIMTFSVSNYIIESPVPTNPYTIYFPSGTYSGGVVVPGFTQTPFNIQITACSPQSGNSGPFNYAATIVDNTSALVYYTGPFNLNSTTTTIYVTVIGI